MKQITAKTTLSACISALWDSPAVVERDAVRDLSQLRRIPLAFGKYDGMELQQVPLKYLDQTISTMPPTWLIRQAQKYVSACMVIIEGYCDCDPLRVPDCTLEQMLNWEKPHGHR